jgi:uncharacterized protein (DUF952 family)
VVIRLIQRASYIVRPLNKQSKWQMLCFLHKKDLVLLCIAANKVQSEIRYEGAESVELYPHIYGPLNVDAVIKVADFEPAKNGKFVLPKEIADMKTAFE